MNHIADIYGVKELEEIYSKTEEGKIEDIGVTRSSSVPRKIFKNPPQKFKNNEASTPPKEKIKSKDESPARLRA